MPRYISHSSTTRRGTRVQSDDRGLLRFFSSGVPGLPDRLVKVVGPATAQDGVRNHATPAMGRKPNPTILEYFERGPKLNDNSNRYPHTCKQCGEIFPKGRIDSLMTHITKKCPAISDSERMRACLEFSGITHARSAAERHQQAQAAQAAAQLNASQVEAPNAVSPQGWSALETLAEASRQVDLNENNRGTKAQAIHDQATDSSITDQLELQEQFTLDNPPASFEASQALASDNKG